MWSRSIKKVDEFAIVPEYKTKGSVGFDFYTIEAQNIGPRELGLVRTGLVIDTPPDHMLMIAPRSSTFKNYGLLMANSVGIVDEDYCGEDDEIYLQFYNPKPSSTFLHSGLRLAQGVFVQISRAEFNEVEQVGSSRGGFGSTGR